VRLRSDRVLNLLSQTLTIYHASLLVALPDTMGYAWAYPFVRFFAGAAMPIGAYVHYPTIRCVPSLPARWGGECKHAFDSS
jgi:hypothetical protein